MGAWTSMMIALVACVVFTANGSETTLDSPTRELPDPFLKSDGSRLANRSDWRVHRKALLDQVLTYEYGQLPPIPRNIVAAQVSTRPLPTLNAEERIVDLSMGPEHSIHTHITLTVPPGAGPFPIIVCGDFIAGDKYWGIRRDWENPGGREFLKTKGPRDTPIFIG
nr:hypothetical protein Hi04_10k_c2089_00002 [uncultured bacterium]